MSNLEEDAANIEAMIMAAAEDEQTMELVKKMKDENAPELIELSKSPIEEVRIKSYMQVIQIMERVTISNSIIIP